MRRMRWLAPLALLLAACGDGGSGGDEGCPAGFDSTDSGCVELPAGEACAEPDLACPLEGSPPLGGPCDGDLACDFTDAEGYEWTYRCTDSEWTAHGGCGEDEFDCAVPELAQGCTEPFDGQLEGAIVRLGPGDSSEAFRRFESDERPDIIIGPQGGAMFAVQLEILGVDVPACVLTNVTMRYGDDDEVQFAMPLAMHCNRSNPFYFQLWTNCGDEDEIVLIEVDVEGIGATSATLTNRARPDDCG